MYGRSHYQRQIQEQQELPQQRQHAGRLAEHVRQPHHPDIVVAHMADLVRQHTNQLAQLELAQQPVGYGDRRVLPATHGKRIEHLAWHVIQGRNDRQTGTPRQPGHRVVQCRRLLPAHRYRPVEPHHQPRGDDGVEQHPDNTYCEQHHNTVPAPQQPAEQRKKTGHDSQQKQRLQTIQPGMLQPDFCIDFPVFQRISPQAACGRAAHG